jgi:hypothetical protein
VKKVGLALHFAVFGFYGNGLRCGQGDQKQSSGTGQHFLRLATLSLCEGVVESITRQAFYVGPVISGITYVILSKFVPHIHCFAENIGHLENLGTNATVYFIKN